MQRSQLVVVFALVVAACGGGADTTTGTTSPLGAGGNGGSGGTGGGGGAGNVAPTVTIALAPSALTVTRVASGATTIAIARRTGLTPADGATYRAGRASGRITP